MLIVVIRRCSSGIALPNHRRVLPYRTDQVPVARRFIWFLPEDSPCRNDADPLAEYGHGLGVVAAPASRVGFRGTQAKGHAVWAELFPV